LWQNEGFSRILAVPCGKTAFLRHGAAGENRRRTKTGMSVIVAENLTKTYRGDVTAVNGVTLSAAAGERIAVLGKSGSGKSTLLNLLGGLDVLTGGRLAVAGRTLSALSRRQLADFRQTCVGFIFQSYHLIPWQSVAQNVAVPLVLAGWKPAARRRAAADILHAVGLGDRADFRPTQLSGGERQRAAVARALVTRPAVLLADEPTGNLDTATARAVTDLILDQVRTRGMTLVLVTHDEDLAARAADRLVRMQDGRAVSDVPVTRDP
jgi:predicted ABC-type transport system involved in lysophospholipase L1 biosynthesis ATPase subunit